MVEHFTFFWSGPFSQWHPSPFIIGGVTYNCAEQFMMAEKARLFGDTKREAMIMSAADPSDQKRFGRQVQGFKEDVWKDNAWNIVKKASIAKYTQNSDLLRALLATNGTTLVEASPEDTIWGIGLHQSDKRSRDRRTWKGTNWLGEILTDVREEINDTLT